MVSQGGPHLHGGDMQVCLIDTREHVCQWLTQRLEPNTE